MARSIPPGAVVAGVQATDPRLRSRKERQVLPLISAIMFVDAAKLLNVDRTYRFNPVN